MERDLITLFKEHSYKLKLRRIIILVLLSLLLGVSGILAYQTHIITSDRHQIEKIIAGDERFKAVTLQGNGVGLFLNGHVAKNEYRDLLFRKINEVKRGRVVSNVQVKSEAIDN